jgi:hypothetical protein
MFSDLSKCIFLAAVSGCSVQDIQKHPPRQTCFEFETPDDDWDWELPDYDYWEDDEDEL